MGIDVVDVVGAEPGIANRILHGARGTLTVLWGSSYMERIVAHTETDHFAMNGGTTAFRVLEILQHQHAGAVAEHKAVPATIPRPAGLFRVVIAGGQRTRCRKRGN